MRPPRGPIVDTVADCSLPGVFHGLVAAPDLGREGHDHDHRCGPAAGAHDLPLHPGDALGVPMLNALVQREVSYALDLSNGVTILLRKDPGAGLPLVESNVGSVWAHGHPSLNPDI